MAIMCMINVVLTGILCGINIYKAVGKRRSFQRLKDFWANSSAEIVLAAIWGLEALFNLGVLVIKYLI